MLRTKKVLKGNSNVFQSISHAFNGLVTAIGQENGIKLIFFSMIFFIALSVFLKLELLELFLVSQAWLLVLIFEINNSAIEKDMDYSSDKDYHPLIKKVKDYAASTVFLSSFFALTISVILLSQKFI